jgi:DNA-binding NtrC family response regulator
MYLFKNKINVADLVDLQRQSKKILIYEPNSDLGQLYSSYFKQSNFEVQHCREREILPHNLMIFSPNLLVYSLDLLHETGSKTFYLQGIKQSFPSLTVVTVGYNLDPEALKNLMNCGVSGHINRQLSRPQDLVTVVKMLL